MRSKRPELNVGMLLFFLFSFFTPQFVQAGQGAPARDTTSREIRGSVSDSSGALIGVAVTVKGRPGVGTQTDVNGRFILDVPDKSLVLVFSNIGYASQEIPIEGRSVIDVQLKKAASDMGEVVVVAFGKQKKTEVVGSVTTIRPGELKIPSSNLTTALAGKLAGVIAYQRSGEPGADNADFFIRGVNTFGYKVDPLILIDNIEVTKDVFARLTTEDIATFTIMKDATATALYGARGANGVILVTTKEGKDGKAKVALRIDNTLSAPTKSVELADAITYMKLQNEALLTRDRGQTPIYTEEKIDNTALGSGSVIYPNTDWRKELIKPTTMNQKGHLSVSGGGKVAQYYIAGAFSQDNGILKVNGQNNFNSNINLKTYQLRSNVNVKLNAATEVIMRLSGVFDDYTGPIPGGAGVYRGIMRTNPVLFPAFYPKDEAHSYLTHIMFGNALPQTGANANPNYYNPYAEMVKGYKDYARAAMTATFEVKNDLNMITKGLTLHSFVSTNRNSFFDVSRQYKPYYYRVTPGSYNAKTGAYNVEVLNPTTGTEYLEYDEGTKTVSSVFHFQSTLNYNRKFDKHSFGGLLVFIARNSLNGNAGNLQNSLPFRNAGLSGRATYSYDGRYFAEFNFGYNGSERFDKKDRFGFFPSAGVAWTVSNEKFWPENYYVSSLKLRGTYGLVGNDQIGSPTDRFFYLSQVNMRDTDKRAVFGDTYSTLLDGITVERYENRDITWETSRKMNVAAEIGLLNNKIEVIAEYFREYRYNILMDRASIPANMGLGVVPRANVGEARAHGIDISIDANHSFNRNFWITARANFTYATSAFKVYEEPQYDEPWLSHVDRSLKQVWGYVAERLFVDDKEVANSPRQVFGTTETRGGDIKYVDLNGDGQITFKDQAPVGYPTVPEIVYGFGVSAGFHKWDLSAFFQGSARSSFWIDPAATAPFVSYYYQDEKDQSLPILSQRLNNQLLKAYADDHWSEDNRYPYALWPRLDYQTNSNNNQVNTWFMRNGAFLRLKQVELGYTLPKAALNKLRIQSTRFYLNGTNLLNFSSFKLWDIEQAGKGLEYPIQKVYNLGVQITF